MCSILPKLLYVRGQKGKVHCYIINKKPLALRDESEKYATFRSEGTE